MKWNLINLKLIASLGTGLVSIAGVVLTFYLWQSDLMAHALSLKLLSSAALQTPSASQFQDLQITLNGQKIEAPYLTSFELVNTGSKSIMTSDFESSIELLTQDRSHFVNAQITGTNPGAIPATISVNNNRVLIAPLLSNPKDSIAFSVITSGEQPIFEVQARIAGVPKISFEDASIDSHRQGILALDVAAMFVMCTMYFAFLIIAFTGIKIILTAHMALLTAAGFLFGALALAVHAGPQLDALDLSTGIKIVTGIIYIAASTAFSIWMAFRIVKDSRANRESP
jgi:hypothetical protein